MARLKKSFLIVIFIFTALYCLNNAAGLGLSVSPGHFIWQEARAGAKNVMPVNMVVKNESSEARLFILKVVSHETARVALGEGFSYLPAEQLVSFSRNQVIIEPGRSIQVKVFLTIPRERKYLDKKWEFFIEVKQSPQGRELFELACYTKINVHTHKRFASR